MLLGAQPPVPSGSQHVPALVAETASPSEFNPNVDTRSSAAVFAASDPEVIAPAPTRGHKRDPAGPETPGGGRKRTRGYLCDQRVSSLVAYLETLESFQASMDGACSRDANLPGH
ncbi:hypothetical protein NDU88_000029 [Pleurodeles waltl]|uniref:Uncharacterized protein n=1 Tax=Pleurodeles waltl TaxID=8319 RepID=A0AAV7NAQ4_PLEWA|nr:hypothetical protein NDU88_000029 [Pleurodeles waltl]